MRSVFGWAWGACDGCVSCADRAVASGFSTFVLAAELSAKREAKVGALRSLSRAAKTFGYVSQPLCFRK